VPVVTGTGFAVVPGTDFAARSGVIFAVGSGTGLGLETRKTMLLLHPSHLSALPIAPASSAVLLCLHSLTTFVGVTSHSPLLPRLPTMTPSLLAPSPPDQQAPRLCCSQTQRLPHYCYYFTSALPSTAAAACPSLINEVNVCAHVVTTRATNRICFPCRPLWRFQSHNTL
jgi:hypothetical protein